MTVLGIDRLLAEPRRWLPRGARIALLANQASTCSDGRPTLEAMRECGELDLRVLLTGEHGWSGFEEDATAIADARDVRTGLALHSLYGPRRLPDPELLDSVDAIIVDIQEVGVRCYTYATTVALLLEAIAREARTRVLICDRPNLLGGNVFGPPLDPRYRSFLGYLDVPYQHGLTLGELARWHAATSVDGRVDLEVVAMEGWRRDSPPPNPWIPPSPGLPSPEAVALYPGLVLLEGTDLSEGRGTPLPFQLLGAPWLDGYDLARDLGALELRGLRFRPISFRPAGGKHSGRVCHGVHLHRIGDEVQSLPALLEVLGFLHRSKQFRWVENASLPWSSASDAGRPWHEPASGLLIDYLAGTTAVREIVEGQPAEPRTVAWAAAQNEFSDSVDACLLYSPGPIRSIRGA